MRPANDSQRLHCAIGVAVEDQDGVAAIAALVASGEFIVNRGEYAMNYNSYLNPIGNEVRVAFTFRARVP